MAMQIAALERALAPWPRRQAPLLEVNCGNGAFLQFLWQCGFDVHGVEADAALRLKAQQRPVPGLEVYAANDDDLPFGNDSFDWVIIHLKTGEKKGIFKCAIEGARLARRGIMITFWNSASLPALCWRIAHRKPWSANAVPWWRVWRQINKLGFGRLSTVSTLAAPVCVWRNKWHVGENVLDVPVGAWCAMRLDLAPAPPVTQLPLRLRATMPGVEPLMEYAPKRMEVQSKEQV